MKAFGGVRLLAVLAVLALAIPALAKSTKTVVRISDPVMVSGTQLKSGEYEFDAGDNKLVVYQGSKKVAEVAITWKEDGKKASATKFTLDGNQLREIHFGGKSSYVVVGG